MNLFIELRRHGKLADKRHPMYEKNRFGRLWMYLMAIFWAGYLVFFGTLFAFVMQDEAREPYHIINSGLIFFLILDFMIRFPFQKTPTQEVKPYLLLPVPRRRVIDFLLLRSGLSGFNLVWLFFFVPFATFTVVRFYGVGGLLGYCLGIWLLMVLNNYWFLLCRTLMNERLAWVLLPLAVYGAVIAAMFVPDDCPLFDWSTDLGEYFITGNGLAYLGVLACIALMWWLNRTLMARLIYAELNKTEDTRVSHLSEYRFLDRYGEVGEYMRLELKLMLRNKVCKTALRTGILVVVMFSLLMSFTDAYDGGFMKSFILVYNFTIFGILFLNAIMSYEGNYIDGLMSRKEAIYSLLRAKYIVYGLGMLIPLLLMVPAMATGKVTVLSCVAVAVFTVGCIYCCLFQMAVYNTRTIDLNAKMTSRNSMGTGLQNLISILAFGGPLAVKAVLDALLPAPAGDWLLLAIGLGFILTSRLWLRNIYSRFMARRYKNMEGFRDSRQG